MSAVVDATFALLAARVLGLLRQLVKQTRIRGRWDQDLYTQCGRTIARYSYRLGAGEMLSTANEARRDAADMLTRAGYTIDLPLGSRDILVVGEADAMPLDREAFLARARADRAQIEGAIPMETGKPNAKIPGGPERRDAAEQMEREAATWAAALPARKRSGVHAALTARLGRGEDIARVGVYLAALVAVMSNAGRWVEPVEPANENRAA